MVKRGQIYYVEPCYSVGSEQRAGRPAIIVSNEKCNEHSDVVEVVYMTTQPKRDMPTHVTIRSTPRESVALCEQITSVSIDRLGDYVGEITAAEMSNMEIAMLISLDLSTGGTKEKIVEVVKEVPVEVVKEVSVPTPAGGGVSEQEKALAVAEAQCELLRSMYADLLSRVATA